MNQQLYSLLGDLPPLDRPISATTVYIKQQANYTLEKLSLDLNGSEIVPAYFVKPNLEKEIFPTVLFCHSHGGKYHIGKDELIYGNTYMFVPPYAESLAAAGFAVLCIDSPIFGERHGKAELEYCKELLWLGKTLWGLMVYDHLRAIDYLHSREDVDKNRIATLGMSMGSTMAWWLAALDSRIAVCADICCMVDFHTLIEQQKLDGHGIYYYVPNLLKYFDTISINSLIAPRPHLSVNGTQDRLVPEEGMDKIDAALKIIYAQKQAADAWQLKKYPVGHVETAEMRHDIMQFLQKWL
ncbi:MAG: dienelactone hydrolase family protein [Firmicutes bacterium]|nr:dienelactone hydrolase family protein [Bacillota bacterium]